jgi:hypothetical protein
MTKILVLVAILVTTLFAANAESAPSSSGISLTGVRLFRYQYPRRPAGLAGDAEIVRWRLNDRHGRPVGFASFSWRWVTARLRLGFGEFRMPQGTIIVAGSSVTRLIVYLPVIGGSGVYERRTGTMRMRMISRGRSAVQFELHP